jgi:hypothetical protein
VSLRALTLVDIINQLQQDAGGEVAYDPNVVINTFVADLETLTFPTDVLTAATVTDYPVALIEDVGPIGYWRLDDAAGSASVFDSSPWATTAWPKVPGAPSATGVTFQAAGAMTGSKGATFNGSAGYVQVPSTTSLSRVGDLSVEMWLKPSGLAATQVLISKGLTGEYHLALNTNGSVTLQMGGPYSTVVVPTGTITAGSWWHLVVTRRAIDKTIKAYVNGTSRYSGTYTTTPSVTSNAVRLGATSPTAGAYFGGTLDEVAIYARPLTATQVANHYAWATPADCSSTPYGTARYGYAQYPKPGAASGATYGDPTTVYGGATYA